MTRAPASDRTVPRSDNFGDGAQALRNELRQFEDDCAELAKVGVTEENKGRFADLAVRECNLRKVATALKEEEKRPFWDECVRIDAAFRNTIATLADALKAPKQKFDAWVLAEDAKREAAARAVREEAERRQREADALAAQTQSADPFAAFEAAEIVGNAQIEADTAARAAEVAEGAGTRVASSLGRSLGVRTIKSIEVVDHEAALAHFKNSALVKTAVAKAASDLGKAQKYAEAIPGCRIVEAKAVR